LLSLGTAAGTTQRWIIAKPRNRKIFSLVELNEAIRACVVDLNSHS